MSAPAIKARTLIEKYYALNTCLSQFLKSRNAICPVVQFGVDPATIKASSKDQTVNRYSYIQTFILNPKVQSWTSHEGGIYTRFEWQLSFFTSPDNEFENMTELWRPYNLARMALSDISLGAFLSIDPLTGLSVSIADLLNVREELASSMVSGAPVPRAVMIAEMASVCAYPDTVPDPGESTDLDLAISYNNN